MCVPPWCTGHAMQFDIVISTETFSKWIILNLQLSDLKKNRGLKMNTAAFCKCMHFFDDHRGLAAYCVVLVGRYSDEGSLRKRVCAETCVVGAKAVPLVCLHNVQARLVFMHGI